MGLREQAMVELDYEHSKARSLIFSRVEECNAADMLIEHFARAWCGDEAESYQKTGLSSFVDGDWRSAYASFPTGIGTIACPYVAFSGFTSFYDAVPLLEAAEKMLGDCDCVDDSLAISRMRRFKWNDKMGTRFIVMIGLSSEAACERVQVGSEPIYELRCG